MKIVILKARKLIKNEYNLVSKLYFQWMQLIRAMPLIWKQKINDSEINVETNYVVQGNHLIKNTRMILLDKIIVRELYSVLLLSSGNAPTSQKYFGKAFSNEKF